MTSSGHQILAQCTPITSLALLENCSVVAAEGPSIIILTIHKNGRPLIDKKKCQPPRFQLFPNHVAISGLCFYKDFGSWGESKGVVWAHNSVTLVRINRDSATVMTPRSAVVNLDFIPIAARWLDEGETLAMVSLLNGLILFKVIAEEGTGTLSMTETGRWGSETETLYCATTAGKSLESLVIFAGTSLKGILVWRPDPNGKTGIVLHRLEGHAGIPFSLSFNERWNFLLSTSDDRTVKVWTFSTRENISLDWADQMIAKAHLMAEMKAVSIRPKGHTGAEQNGDGDKAEVEPPEEVVKVEPEKPKHWLPPLVQVQRTITGHESRVWNAIWVNFEGFLFLVSVGEDSYIRVESYDETVSKNWRGHDGAPIYSCVHDERFNLLYTGGHDGAVNIWRDFAYQNKPKLVLRDRLTPCFMVAHLVILNKYERSVANKDFPRNVIVWGQHYLLALMDKGRILAYNYTRKFQRACVWYHDNMKRTGGVMALCSNESFLALGGIRGEFFIMHTVVEDWSNHHKPCLPEAFLCDTVFECQFESKIINLHWVPEEMICIVVTLGTAYVIQFYRYLKPGVTREKPKLDEELFDLETTTVKGKYLIKYDLASLARPGLPAMLMTNPNFDWCLGGDEVGNIHVWYGDPKDKRQKHGEDYKAGLLKTEEQVHCGPPVKSLSVLKNVHKEGVTCLVEYNGWIMSGGKHGGVKRLKLEVDEVTGIPKLMQVQQFFPPFPWVASMKVTMLGKELIVAGFHKGSFLLYSWEQKRILNEITDVGGGHRRWSWQTDPGGNATLGFMRDRELYFCPITLRNSIESVLKPGLHSRTINCGILLGTMDHNKDDYYYMATGSEDGSIRILSYYKVGHVFETVHRITTHSSSVRTIVAVRLGGDDNSVLLWSGGGRSEINATIFGLNSKDAECRPVGHIVLVGSGKKNLNKGDETDIRVMDLALLPRRDKNNFLLGAGSSDGLLRILSYSLTRARFDVLMILEGNGHALLTVHLAEINGIRTVVGGGSNGDLMLWRLPKVANSDDDEDDDANLISTEKMTPSFQQQVRTCAVMSMAIKMSINDDNRSIDIVLGGDDCSVSLWRLTNDLEPKLDLVWSHDEEQRGAVTGVVWGKGADDVIFSCSNDQVISRWGVESGDVLGTAMSGVKDCQGFVLSPEDDILMCYGTGVSWIMSP